MQIGNRSASLPRSEKATPHSHSPLRSPQYGIRLNTVGYSQNGYSNVLPIILGHDEKINDIQVVHDDLQEMPFYDEEIVYPRTTIRAFTPDLSSPSEHSDFSISSPEITRPSRTSSSTPELPSYRGEHQPRSDSCPAFNSSKSKGLTLYSPLDEVFNRQHPLPLPLASISSALETEGGSPVSIDEDWMLGVNPSPVPLLDVSKIRRPLSANDAEARANVIPHNDGSHVSWKGAAGSRPTSREDTFPDIHENDVDFSSYSREVHNCSPLEPPDATTGIENDESLIAFEAFINFISSPLPHPSPVLDETSAPSRSDNAAIAIHTSPLLLDLSSDDVEAPGMKTEAWGFTLVFKELAQIDFSSPSPPDVSWTLGEFGTQVPQATHSMKQTLEGSESIVLAYDDKIFTHPSDSAPAELWSGEFFHINPSLPEDLDNSEGLKVLRPPGPLGFKVEKFVESKDLIQWLDDADRLECLVRKAWDAVLSLVSDKKRCTALVRECQGDLAQPFIDVIQMLIDFPPEFKHSEIDKKNLFIALIRLAKTSFLYPRCLNIKDVQIGSDIAATFGGFGDIFKGTLKNIPICVKMLKCYESTNLKRLAKDYAKEVVMWSHTMHINVLPFYGTFYDEKRQRLCLLSPWMENGNVAKYLKANPSTNRILLIGDIINGIAYLHQHSIVHGDLKAANILVTNSGRACLADFGLSIKQCDVWSSVDSSASCSGTTRWTAPEIFGLDEANDSDKYGRATNESDIYAFAGVCYEIFTGKYPFYETPNEAAVIFRIIRGDLPSCPNLASREAGSHFSLGLVPEIWHVMVQCWSKRPEDRPSVESIVDFIFKMGIKDTRPSVDETESALWNLRKDLHRSSEHVSMDVLEGVIDWATTH